MVLKCVQARVDSRHLLARSQPPDFFTVLAWAYANAVTHPPIWEQALKSSWPEHVNSFLFCFQACWPNWLFYCWFKKCQFLVSFCCLLIFSSVLYITFFFKKNRFKLFSRRCDYYQLSETEKENRMCRFFSGCLFCLSKKVSLHLFVLPFSSPHLLAPENWKHERRPCLSIGLRARKSWLFPWLTVCVLGQSVTITDKSCA